MTTQRRFPSGKGPAAGRGRSGARPLAYPSFGTPSRKSRSRARASQAEAATTASALTAAKEQPPDDAGAPDADHNHAEALPEAGIEQGAPLERRSFTDVHLLDVEVHVVGRGRELHEVHDRRTNIVAEPEKAESGRDTQLARQRLVLREIVDRAASRRLADRDKMQVRS